MRQSDIIYVGNARCYHTMDWYRSAKTVCAPRKVLFATDLIESEGHVRLVNNEDHIIPLFNVDRLLLKTQSKFGNLWRNAVKLLAIPLQVSKLKTLALEHPGAVYHAHTMYYMFVCWLAGIRFIGTPQGSEVLVRPNRSRLYRYFAIKSLLAADHITVDSIKMRDRIRELCGVEAVIVQNGIDVASIRKIATSTPHRYRVVSIRAITPLYRIKEICHARAASKHQPALTFFYPFWEEGYKATLSPMFRSQDIDLGRLSREEMYSLLASTLLAISIPSSDSSPRTVYEAIFFGCCVAVTYHSYIEALPDCMKARLFIVDLEDPMWLDKALRFAEQTTAKPYVPSEQALQLFDQQKSMQIVVDSFY